MECTRLHQTMIRRSHPSIRASKKQRTEASDQKSAAMQAPSSCKSFYLIEAFLVSSSKYFRTRLETAVGGLETEMSTVGRSRTLVILHDYIDEWEEEAVELVLKFFYAMDAPLLSNLIPSTIDAKVPLLLKALMVAERYQADICKEKIAAALSSIPAHSLSSVAVKAMFEHPADLCRMPSLSGFSLIAVNFLHQRFGDLPLVIKSNALCPEFLNLPFHAVLTLIKRDDLKVHSENDVVYLLNEWIKKNAPSSDQRDALIKEIRVTRLGPAYLHSILPNLQWFKESSLSRSIFIVLIARDGKEKLNVSLVKIRYPDFPPSWLAAPRKAPGYTPPTSTAFAFVLKEDQLKELYDRNKVLSEPVYRNGHWIKGFAQQRKSQGAEVFSFTVGYEINQTFSGFQYLLQLNQTFAIDKVGGAPERKSSYFDFLTSDRGCGGWGPAFLERKCPTFQEVVAPYLVDGKLTIKYEISEVD